MLAKLDVQLVIVGHSERRELFGETDEWVNQKVQAVLRARDDADPVRAARRSTSARRATRRPRSPARCAPAWPGVTAEQVAGMVIAYEPIWAIGTGPDGDARGRPGGVRAVRATVAELDGAEAAAAVRIQYGGSVKPANIAELMASPTSTARSSAAPASTPTSSPKSCGSGWLRRE